jgi:hypothetical protein
MNSQAEEIKLTHKPLAARQHRTEDPLGKQKQCEGADEF